VEVTLSGKVNGAERLYVYPDQVLAGAGGEPFVARLWATRKLGVLMDEVRRSGANDELIDAIIDLSLRYGIVTPYTSYLVQEPGMLLDVAGAGGEFPAAAPIPLDQRALRYSVEAAAVAEAAAPAAGAMAVEQRLQRQSLSEATVAQQEETLRYVAGRTFRLQGTTADANGAPVALWVDVNFTDDMAVTEVIFGSDEYFDLLETSPAMAAWLSLSPTVVVVTGADEAVRVVLEEGVESR
jgi:Ca-activated chloride channel family protein